MMRKSSMGRWKHWKLVRVAAFDWILILLAAVLVILLLLIANVVAKFLGLLGGNWADWLTVGIALFAIVVSIFSYRHVKRVTEASIVTAFLEEYASKRMLKSLALMGEWRDRWEHKVGAWRACDVHSWEKHWAEIAEEYGDAYSEVSDARRNVKLYFYKAWRLYPKYIDKDIMEIITGQSGYSLLFGIVWPLEVLHRFKFIGPPPEGSDEWFKELKGEFGDGSNL